MGKNPRTIIVRHAKERLKKCTLFGLEDRPDFLLLTFRDNEVLVPRGGSLPDLTGHIRLTLDEPAPVLRAEDADRGLLILDGTWRLTRHMAHCMAHLLEPTVARSLPGEIRTAYPRYQTGCPDPERGLASVEALYAAYVILGRDPAGLLDHYHFGPRFLELNDRAWAGRAGSPGA